MYKDSIVDVCLADNKNFGGSNVVSCSQSAELTNV